MSRALRYAPPLADRGLIVRPRLLARLHTRFERRLTAVVAPAGFGKTTLLAQAVQENTLSPLGEDRWLTCQRDDTALSFLASGAFAAVGVTAPVPDDPRDAAVTVADAIWSAAPQHVALILDDAHLVDAASPGGHFVTGLVEELPRNGHVVLASRPPLLLPTARLLANGDAVVVGEQELHFEDDEVAAFAASRHVAPDLLRDVGGWPALAELTATAGPYAISGYVWEELLSRLSPDRRRALAVLVAVGGADDELATALLGEEVRLETLLDGLPLVVRGPSGWWSLHGLWAEVLQRHLDPAQLAQARRTAGLVLARRRRYHDAANLLTEAGAWDDVRQLVVEVCEVGTPLVPPDVLDVWLRRLPTAVQGSPEGLLLSAMVAEPASPDAAEEILERAFALAPDVAPVRVACLNALVEVAFRRGDGRNMQRVIERLTELAAHGHERAASWIPLFRGLLARTPAQVQAELASPALVAGRALSPVQEWLRGHLLLRALGDAAAAESVARTALEQPAPNLVVQIRCLLLESLLLRGRLDEAAEVLPDLLAGIDPARVRTSPESVTYAVMLLGVLGRDAEAAELLRATRAALADSSVAWAPVAAAVAEAVVAVSAGDETAAAAALRSVQQLRMGRRRAVQLVASAALPLFYVLLPELRAQWDAEPPPGCLEPVLDLARALVAVREGGALEPVRQLSAEARAVVRTVLPAPWAAELALGMVAAGFQQGRALVEELGPRARPVLRARSSGGPAPVAAAARRLLREVPAAPPSPLELRVLGPMQLRRDGAVVVARELRRERVRQLLGYLLTHDRPTRAAVTADLWPDLDEVAAARNLRVTLAYLHCLLEPDRCESDPPYFVRSTGPVLHLVVDESLQVDAVLFERHLDEAARLERQGAPSAALDTYRQALALWDTDYLPDVSGGDWLEWERDRLRGRFVAAAIRAGELSLARGDTAAARALGQRALRIDDWSEEAHQLLVAALLESGDPAGARRQLRRCLAVLEDLGAPPQPRTVELARRLELRRRRPAGSG
ncbi:MAG TPA: BTAD domain-containing putative transcriptional regulator [Geodermatophilus sp.]|jgi:LuxR family transcriptional regulator, maltose regulon positive regulatory protein|nr:BTAD domain-containing putative transcriptional regulator [Geodermatophilus sp.]